ncbi:MAG: hypothetical protein LDL39_03280 [Magnetospirillum sp.]|nr:hypothetical protein [Magnetospirillum sp.]
MESNAQLSVLEVFLNNAQTVNGSVFVVSLVMVFAAIGFFKISPDSPFAPYAREIVAVMLLLPCLMISAIALKLESSAITGLLGTIVGYFFGAKGK